MNIVYLRLIKQKEFNANVCRKSMWKNPKIVGICVVIS